jgi:anti-sigma factor RsiW
MLLAVEDGNCIRARQMFSLALDGEAAASEVLMAATHIGSCEGCRQFAKRVVALTNELRSVGASPPHHQKANARDRREIMKGKRISRLLLLAAVTATIGATAAAGQVGQKSSPSKLCPERAAAPCPNVPVPVRSEVKPQRPSIRPQAGFDARGEPAWRAGTWLMY